MRFAQTWSSCTVQQVRDLTSRIREITLRPDGGVEPYSAGSHVDVNVLVDGRPETRSYSLVGDAGPGGYRIAVRLASDGRGGVRVTWGLKARGRARGSRP